ncbi:hypothetical protein N780_08790 [Pontibacillus chungwhensis BH030062]|uniref:Uncharacterized protein n=1 Tax=Pontibacillus chungwhensis BH030062 TaxID=1385513 RepID=A0A0A2VC79_9BACI|nr:hypothetical protein [Pontibacillus chungwhensis]KGP91275.1 hypothetical protein N780_08790 [Pontibacillus chungwhensis BH030062]
MLGRGKSTAGKVLAYVGLWVFAAGFAFSDLLGIEGTPELLETLSIPLMVVGVLMLVSSNFFRIKH